MVDDWAELVLVCPDGGVTKRVLKHGDESAPKPSLPCRVKLRYTGARENLARST